MAEEPRNAPAVEIVSRSGVHGSPGIGAATALRVHPWREGRRCLVTPESSAERPTVSSSLVGGLVAVVVHVLVGDARLALGGLRWRGPGCRA